MTQERLDELRAIPHVVSVEPDLNEYARIYLDGNTTPGPVAGILPNARHLAQRIEVGTGFTGSNAHEAIVSEYLLYRLGNATMPKCKPVSARPFASS